MMETVNIAEKMLSKLINILFLLLFRRRGVTKAQTRKLVCGDYLYTFSEVAQQDLSIHKYKYSISAATT